jgi:hypothetical protein
VRGGGKGIYGALSGGVAASPTLPGTCNTPPPSRSPAPGREETDESCVHVEPYFACIYAALRTVLWRESFSPWPTKHLVFLVQPMREKSRPTQHVQSVR